MTGTRSESVREAIIEQKTERVRNAVVATFLKELPADLTATMEDKIIDALVSVNVAGHVLLTAFAWLDVATPGAFELGMLDLSTQFPGYRKSLEVQIEELVAMLEATEDGQES